MKKKIKINFNKPSRYPNNDSLSMQNLAFGNQTSFNNYPYQFVQDETILENKTDADINDAMSLFLVKYTPILPGTLTGTIYANDVPVQTFFFNSLGHATINKLHDSFHQNLSINYKAIAAAIGWQLGRIVIAWNQKPETSYIVINYEYNLELQVTDS